MAVSSRGQWPCSSQELSLDEKSSATLWEATLEGDTTLCLPTLSRAAAKHQIPTLVGSARQGTGTKQNLTQGRLRHQGCLPWAPLRTSILNCKAQIYREGHF